MPRTQILGIVFFDPIADRTLNMLWRTVIWQAGFDSQRVRYPLQQRANPLSKLVRATHGWMAHPLQGVSRTTELLLRHATHGDEPCVASE